MTGGTLERRKDPVPSPSHVRAGLWTGPVGGGREDGMPIGAGSDLHYLVGPVIAFAVLALLAVFMRWAFGTGYGKGTDRRATPPPLDDGLLTLVATLSRRESALALRAVLSDAGIRSTVRCPAPHRADVLVFPEDAARARSLAAIFPGN